MSEYYPRLTAPSYTDLRWTQVESGGYNRCIYGNGSSTQVIPNCTGYVHGRWMELANSTSDNLGLSFNDANTYWTTSSSSIARSSEPVLGAIACYGYTPNGHVAIVEEIIDVNTIRCSESDWGGPRFSVRIRRREWNWDWIPNGNPQFQGFLLHPSISPTPPTPTGNGFKWWMARLLLERRRNGL